MTIRPATRDDAAAIAAVHVASWHETYTGMLPQGVIARNTDERRRALWERMLADPTRDVFIATENAVVIGFICDGGMPESIRGRPPIPDHDAYVDALYVLAAAHGRGVGRALLAALAQRLAARGFRSLALHVVAENPARGFYERLGARFIAAEPYADGVDEGVQLSYGWGDVAELANAVKTRREPARASTRVSRIVKAPRDVVYRACLDPDAVAVWRVPDTMKGEMHAFDAHEGGTFSMSLRYENRDDSPGGKTSEDTDTFQGRFVALVPDQKIVEAIEFDSHDPRFAGEMTITTTFADADGGTEVTILCRDIPPGIRAEDNELGTRQSLRKLAKLVESSAPTGASVDRSTARR